METLQHFLQYLLHIDDYLIAFVTAYGPWTYAILFTIVFCETGFVIIPFLPGDSLLFAAGTIAANSSHALNIHFLFILLATASILGNKTNYFIGRLIGPRIFSSEKLWFSRKYLEEAHQFYEKHGGKTIILARFLPVLRTFGPFVAGIAYMDIGRFVAFNILSAFIWIGSLLYGSYFFGNLPIVKQHFSIVIYSIIGISLTPPLFAFLYHKLFIRN